jgi:hypothetical protein
MKRKIENFFALFRVSGALPPGEAPRKLPREPKKGI